MRGPGGLEPDLQQGRCGRVGPGFGDGKEFAQDQGNSCWLQLQLPNCVYVCWWGEGFPTWPQAPGSAPGLGKRHQEETQFAGQALLAQRGPLRPGKGRMGSVRLYPAQPTASRSLWDKISSRGLSTPGGTLSPSWPPFWSSLPKLGLLSPTLPEGESCPGPDFFLF